MNPPIALHQSYRGRCHKVREAWAQLYFSYSTQKHDIKRILLDVQNVSSRKPVRTHTHGVFLGKIFSRWASYYESILSIFFETSFCTNGLIRHKKSNIFESVLLTQKNVSIESRSHPLHIDITYILNIPLEKKYCRSRQMFDNHFHFEDQVNGCTR